MTVFIASAKIIPKRIKLLATHAIDAFSPNLILFDSGCKSKRRQLTTTMQLLYSDQKHVGMKLPTHLMRPNETLQKHVQNRCPLRR
jgi:hypothetical protein